jgi:hypothetical protein
LKYVVVREGLLTQWKKHIGRAVYLNGIIESNVTIETEAAVGAGVVCVGLRDVRGVEEGVIANHVVPHVIGPFEDLGTNADEESIGGPSSC